ncbi:transketolase [bacterium]|nr:transketolase [bacterium]
MDYRKVNLQPANQDELDYLAISTIRFLSIDAVEKANSGHPGAPMGMAPMAWTLWSRHLRFNPADPGWFNRDRFILSNGHASMLQYAMLHLSGYELGLEDLKNFRQWHSPTAGHPEVHDCPGVEVTTGPLGQGISHAVGFALAERWLAAQSNRPGHDVINHYTYVFCSDGDLMEGVSSEACSLAGHLKLGKLICLYDSNSISIEGSTDLAFTEDVAARYRSYGWQVLLVEDGNDVTAIDHAIRDAQADRERPSLIEVRTNIGYGSPKQDSASSHGSPLGKDAVAATREAFGWPEESFLVPEAVASLADGFRQRGQEWQQAWQQGMDAYAQEQPEEAARLSRWIKGDLPAGWNDGLDNLFPADDSAASRASSGKVLNVLGERLGNLVGGSADLEPSNKSWQKHSPMQAAAEHGGNNIRFGVREHGMGAIANGMTLHGGLRGYTATFLQFADYMRPSMRLAALMKLPSIFVFTHDSIGLGEDGPTHQPVEHLMSLRVMPNMLVMRPADSHETAVAWQIAIEQRDRPSCLILTRQDLPTLRPDNPGLASCARKGAYIARECKGEPEVILIGTGSEVLIAMQAADRLAAEGRRVRVVSMMSWELFEQQSASYRENVLPAACQRRVVVEAGIRLGWERYAGSQGRVIGMDSFGASAPAEVLYEKFGITSTAVYDAASELLGG